MFGKLHKLRSDRTRQTATAGRVGPNAFQCHGRLRHTTAEEHVSEKDETQLMPHKSNADAITQENNGRIITVSLISIGIQ
jgi:hypothetical protein